MFFRGQDRVHHYEEVMEDPDPHAERLLALWEQIAERYKGYPAGLLFEILNEPHDKLDAGAWNRLLGEAIEAIRETNPERAIIVGPVFWNNVNSLHLLELPQDDVNLIVTVHYYNPFQFAHQGAERVDGSDPWLGTSAQEKALSKTWSRRPPGRRGITGPST